MTADFVTLAIVLGLTLLVSTILGFIVSPLYGVANMVPAALVYAWALWSQHCLRAGNCKALAWLTTVMWIVYAILIITVMSLIVWATRRAKRDAQRAELKAAREETTSVDTQKSQD